MKLKKIMLITCLLLAVITIGAVSASENNEPVDDLAVSDIAQDSIEQPDIDEDADELQSADADEKLSDLGPEDFKVNISKSFDLNDEDAVAISYYCPKGAEGIINVYMDDNFMYNNYIDSSDEGNIFKVHNFYDDLDPKTYSVLVEYEPVVGESFTIATGILKVTKTVTADDFEVDWTDVYDDYDPVVNVWNFPITGNLTVSVNGVPRYSKEIDNIYDDIYVYRDDVGITENGVYAISVDYITSDSQKISLGQQNILVDIQIYDDNIYIKSDVIIFDSNSFIYIEDEYVNGTVRVYVDDVLKLTKTYSANDKNYDVDYTLDDLNLNDIAVGYHTVKVVYMKNNVDEHVCQSIVNFYVEPSFETYYYISVGEKETIVVNYIKGVTGTVKLYNAVSDEDDDYVKGTLIRSANFVNGVATIPFDSLAKGEYVYILEISANNYNLERRIYVYVEENTPGFSASVPSEITAGNNLVVNFNGKPSSGYVHILVDGKEVKSVALTTGVLSENIAGLSVGQHKIKVDFYDGSNQYSNTFYVTVKQASSPSKTPAKNDISLTLKNAAVKKSAKKLTLQATLKINKKAVKGKKITFNFNGKKYTAKTNKKGIAKVTIKKAALKKLKVGKKITYTAKYSTKTVKKTVKVKK